MKKIIFFCGFMCCVGIQSSWSQRPLPAVISDVNFDSGLGTAAINQVKHIRWGTTKNPLEGLTITWRSNGAADMIKWGYTTAFEKGTFNGVSRAGYDATFFNYTFPILNSNATLYYALFDSKDNSWSAQKTYETAPPVNTDSFSFIATGDSRGGPEVWQAISNLANAQQTDLTIFNGDIVADAGVASQWNEWFDAGAAFLEKNLVLHAMGNHDALSVPTYLNNFELPKSAPVSGTELYYAVKYGNAIFISLNSEGPDETAQYNWLKSTLQANVNTRWKIISFHKPFFSMGPHSGEMDDYLATWWKAFDDYGVDLVLNGHDHMYERTKPLNRNVSTTSPVANYGSGPNDGRCQIVCGGAGAGLTQLSDGWFLESYKESHNFCKFDVTADRMCGTVYDENSLVIDSFCIEKGPLGTTSSKVTFYPLKIIPNPATGMVKIEYSSPNMGDVSVNVFNISGKKLDSKKSEKAATDFTFAYDASQLAAGVYIVEVQMANQKDHVLMVRK